MRVEDLGQIAGVILGYGLIAAVVVAVAVVVVLGIRRIHAWRRAHTR